jgi:hypothetical protein
MRQPSDEPRLTSETEGGVRDECTIRFEAARGGTSLTNGKGVASVARFAALWLSDPRTSPYGRSRTDL